MTKENLEEEFNKLKTQNEQYQSVLQNNHNIMQQIIGKVQLLDEQEKSAKTEIKPTKKQ